MNLFPAREIIKLSLEKVGFVGAPIIFPLLRNKKNFFQQSFEDYANVCSTVVKTFTIFNTAGLKKLSDNAKRPIAIMLNDQLYTVAKRQCAISKRKR